MGWVPGCRDWIWGEDGSPIGNSPPLQLVHEPHVCNWFRSGSGDAVSGFGLSVLKFCD